MYIDTHAHIHDDDFGDADAAIARARHAGVTTIVTLGVTRADSEHAIALAERHDGVLAAAGVHPHDAKDASEADLDALEKMASHPRVVMVGEIGLDYYRNLSPRDVQRRVLLRQLKTAGRVGKPVAVHARDAHDDMLPLLEAWSREMGGRLAAGSPGTAVPHDARRPGTAVLRRSRPLGVMHYFSEGIELAHRYVELGFMISVHTSVTHPKAAVLQSVAREAPLDALVIETDSPYGAPQRYRGKRNEPAYVVEAAAKIAELRGISVDDVASATTTNALGLLGLEQT
jgi:TatD DNase family protein